ncbi:MAG: histidinol phosphate phosphatase [Deltaproteobacteria bacterium CG11_big_fil_rev_8_21_14_0_20_47_16]|nr:MAG: histidinol phosphate phosphatase [Deltaproteobacteria bacterium CG11_big_fil_rev_8_21_14_0_20_47_16]
MKNLPQKQRAIFLDRDGVINKSIMRGPNWVGSPRELHEWQWTDHIHEAIRKLHAAGYLLIVVTNQPEVPRKQLTIGQLTALHELMCRELPEIDDVYACTHDNEDNCNCRKPRPGMLLEAAKKWDIDLKNSWMIGDRAKDIEAGKAAGCKTCLIEYGYTYPCDPDLTCKSLLEFVAVFEK